MKYMVEFKLGDGSTILVEVDELEAGGTVRASRSGEVIEKAKDTFDEALSIIRPAAESIITQLRHMSRQPDEIEVGFGIKLSAVAGAIIAAVASEANFNVMLRGNHEEHKEV